MCTLRSEAWNPITTRDLLHPNQASILINYWAPSTCFWNVYSLTRFPSHKCSLILYTQRICEATRLLRPLCPDDHSASTNIFTSLGKPKPCATNHPKMVTKIILNGECVEPILFVSAKFTTTLWTHRSEIWHSLTQKCQTPPKSSIPIMLVNTNSNIQQG